MAEIIDIEDLLYWAFRDLKVETRRDAPEDALTVYWAVMALPAPFDHIVRHHARIGRPPEWRSSPDARVVHLVAVRHWRERYTQWHGALSILRHTLNGALRDHAASGPAAPRMPWHSDAPPVSRSWKRAL